METNGQIEIALSKNKLVLMLLGCIAFVAIGIWFVVKQPVSDLPVLGNPVVVLIVGIASIGLFGLIGVLLIKKLGDNTPGLIISNKGITDNTSAMSAGFIPWGDIIEMKEITVVNQTFINVVVKNPQDYIDRQKSAFKRKSLQMNYKSSGCVIGLTSNGLKCNYKELKELLDNKFSEFKSK
jgi:hypothetical protein